MIKLHSIFKFREQATEQIIALLDSVVLGTNGAHYRHLDTREQIKEADNPLFLSMERNDKVLANVTFCRRGTDWYIRYFAFDKALQSAGTRRTNAPSKNLLRSELENFFKNSLCTQDDEEKVDRFYAYIDPKNEKSLWMSENFQFKPVAKLSTQTYSRRNPIASNRIRQIDDWQEIRTIIEKRFGNYNFFSLVHTCKPPFFVINNEQDEVIACAKTTTANWEIQRLPGKFGLLLVKLIPWIPVVRRLIKPKEHTFVVPEAVYVKGNDPKLLSELFDGILKLQQRNLLIWWVDVREPLYVESRKTMRWGLIHKLIGTPQVDVVVRSGRTESVIDPDKPVYTIGYDFI